MRQTKKESKRQSNVFMFYVRLINFKNISNDTRTTIGVWSSFQGALD